MADGGCFLLTATIRMPRCAATERTGQCFDALDIDHADVDLGTLGQRLIVQVQRGGRPGDKGVRSVGDAALVEVASRLRTRVRASDHVTRYGGATFGVVLTDISRDDAERFAEKIRAELGSAPYCDDRIVLQFSAGVVGIYPMLDDDDGDPVTRWARRADEALFDAKRQPEITASSRPEAVGRWVSSASHFSAAAQASSSEAPMIGLLGKMFSSPMIS